MPRVTIALEETNGIKIVKNKNKKPELFTFPVPFLNTNLFKEYEKTILSSTSESLSDSFSVDLLLIQTGLCLQKLDHNSIKWGSPSN